MIALYHSTFDPASRTVRQILGEYGVPVTLVEEKVFDRRADFLAMNPAGTVPVLLLEDERVIAGPAAVLEYLSETLGKSAKDWTPMPDDPVERAEVRRICEWFDVKFNTEVTLTLAHEKIDRRFMPRDHGGGPPDMAMIKAGLANIRYHMKYLDHLLSKRHWLAGDVMTRADMTAAAHLSAIDYLGHVPWDDASGAREWYARIKSRPSFRPLLADRVPGMPPAPHYDDPDF